MFLHNVTIRNYSVHKLSEDKEFSKQFARVEKYEGISDNMELEIARFLNLVSDGRLSSESKLKIRYMLRRRYATGIAMDVDLPTADLYTDLTNTSHFATPTG